MVALWVALPVAIAFALAHGYADRQAVAQFAHEHQLDLTVAGAAGPEGLAVQMVDPGDGAVRACELYLGDQAHLVCGDELVAGDAR